MTFEEQYLSPVAAAARARVSEARRMGQEIQQADLDTIQTYEQMSAVLYGSDKAIDYLYAQYDISQDPEFYRLMSTTEDMAGLVSYNFARGYIDSLRPFKDETGAWWMTSGTGRQSR